jgi:HNH endonuclease
VGNGLPHELRFEVIRSAATLAEQSGTLFACPLCGFEFVLGLGDPNIEVDHVVPISQGGEHALSNLRPLCFYCNRCKRTGAAPPDLTRAVVIRVIKCICGKRNFVHHERYAAMMKSGEPHDCDRCKGWRGEGCAAT